MMTNSPVIRASLSIFLLMASSSSMAFGSISSCDDDEVVLIVEDLGTSMVAEQVSAFEDDVSFEVFQTRESRASSDEIRVCQAEVISRLPDSTSITSIARYSISETDWSGEYYVELKGSFLEDIMDFQIDKEMQEIEAEVEKDMQNFKKMMEGIR